jgi:hypothetical protein
MEQRWVGNTAFANELPDSSVLSVKFITSATIGCHRSPNVPGLIFFQTKLQKWLKTLNRIVGPLASKYLDFRLKTGHSRANLANSSTRKKFAILASTPICQKWPFSAKCRTRRHLPNHFARTRQTCERQVWQVLCEFSELGKFGQFSECRLDRFIHGHSLFSTHVIIALVHPFQYSLRCILLESDKPPMMIDLFFKTIII